MAQSPRRRQANDRPTKKIPVSSLRDQILQHFQTLKIPLTAEQLDETLSRAEREGLSHLEFVHGLVSDQASSRRERSIARRIDEAKFRDPGTLENFDWKFNEQTIDRARFEELATGEFVRRGENFANLFYKVIEARYPHRSTALVTNVDFTAWNEYLGDPPLAMAFLDRVVDGAIVMKLEGESYRAGRAKRVSGKSQSSSAS